MVPALAGYSAMVSSVRSSVARPLFEASSARREAVFSNPQPNLQQSMSCCDLRELLQPIRLANKVLDSQSTNPKTHGRHAAESKRSQYYSNIAAKLTIYAGRKRRDEAVHFDRKLAEAKDLVRNTSANLVLWR